MKGNKLFIIASFVVLCCTMLSCNTETTVYGTIARSGGDPVPNLKVSLEYGDYAFGFTPVYSAITGSDGLYEITFDYNLDDQRTYWIHLGEGAYSYNKVNINRGKMNRFDYVY